MDWDDLLKREAAIRAEYDDLWAAASKGPYTEERAKRTLLVMWERTHLDLHRKYPGVFPTVQRYPEQLRRVSELWWVDHATAGVSHMGTLAWFSNIKRPHSRVFETVEEASAYQAKRTGAVRQGTKVSWEGLAGASTHFVVAHDGTPFYVVNINHAAWHEPLRNMDSIAVEVVNALVCTKKDGVWRYWAGPLPTALAAPVKLEEPFRGAVYMQPYTWEQVITNIKLKRLCIAATGRMAPAHMSEHTKWNAKKFDMGPLWPYDLCNKVAFQTYPVEAYDFVQEFVRAPTADAVVDVAELKALELTDDICDDL